MPIYQWLMWAAVLFLQNISFTYVSRARSSGSLLRHAKASVFSNGIWIFSNMLMLGPMFDYLTGKHGRHEQALTGLVYTVACVGGSLFAHYLAMKTEKGKNAVGYNKKYAQIPVEEWASMKAKIERAENLAEQAHTAAFDGVPVAAISAAKINGETVISGVNLTK